MARTTLFKIGTQRQRGLGCEHGICKEWQLPHFGVRVQARLEAILQFYANYKAAEKKPNPCFWPAVANTTSAGPAAPVCTVPTTASPAEFFHGKDTALQVRHLLLPA